MRNSLLGDDDDSVLQLDMTLSGVFACNKSPKKQPDRSLANRHDSAIGAVRAKPTGAEAHDCSVRHRQIAELTTTQASNTSV